MNLKTRNFDWPMNSEGSLANKKHFLPDKEEEFVATKCNSNQTIKTWEVHSKPDAEEL